MPYRDRTIRVDLSDLDEGLFVKLLNPAMRTMADTIPEGIDPATGEPNGSKSAIRLGKELLADLIVDWKVWDATVEDQDVPLPLPKDDPTALDRVPSVVLSRLNAELVSRRPLASPDTPTSTKF